jgi:hypothetical protein
MTPHLGEGGLSVCLCMNCAYDWVLVSVHVSVAYLTHGLLEQTPVY